MYIFIYVYICIRMYIIMIGIEMCEVIVMYVINIIINYFDLMRSFFVEVCLIRIF